MLLLLKWKRNNISCININLKWRKSFEAIYPIIAPQTRTTSCTCQKKGRFFSEKELSTKLAHFHWGLWEDSNAAGHNNCCCVKGHSAKLVPAHLLGGAPGRAAMQQGKKNSFCAKEKSAKPTLLLLLRLQGVKWCLKTDSIQHFYRGSWEGSNSAGHNNQSKEALVKWEAPLPHKCDRGDSTSAGIPGKVMMH